MAKRYSGDTRIDSVLIDAELPIPAVQSWSQSTSVGSGVSLTYNWMTFAPASAPAGGFTPFSASQQAGAVAALNLISEIANVTFTQSATANADLMFGNLDFGGSPSGYIAGLATIFWSIDGIPPTNTYLTHADIYLTNTFSVSQNQTPGSQGFSTLIHEIGHGLGLEHTFENVLPPFGTDSEQYSVMSYTPHSQMFVSPSTPMLYDIAALQYLYGANYTTRTGNDIYSWNTDDAVLMTIWDAGGFDYISAASQYRDVVINLEPGTFSSIGTNGVGGNAVNNIAIAFGAQIEAATGGSGNDQLYGNSTNNVLTGNAGYDYIDGGAGFDYISYGSAATGIIVQLYSNTANSDGTGTYDLLANIEGVLGGSHADLMSGDSNANHFFAGDGNDQIFAGHGDDILGGGAGSNYLYGDLGNDYFSFQAGDFATNEFTTVADFNSIASNFDYLLFGGIQMSELDIFTYGGHTFITPTSLNYSGGIVVLNTIIDQSSDQLVYY